MPQTVVVSAARNLGGAIIDHFLGLGWNAAGAARSEETLDRVRSAGALALLGERWVDQVLGDPRHLLVSTRGQGRQRRLAPQHRHVAVQPVGDRLTLG
jgi:hypothetical protein